VEFDDGIDDQLFKALFQDAQTRFSQVTLPDGTLPAILDDFSSSDFLPVVEVIISGNLPYQELREQALALQNEILKVGDVADVQIIGLPERQIQVQLDPTMLASLGLSVNEVVRSISEQNRSVPSGNLTTQSREYLIRTLGSIREVDDINSVIVRRSNQGEGIIRVSDVARVVDGFEKDTPFNRFNGSPSVSLRVTKVVKGNSVSIVDRVRSIVEEQQQVSGAKLTLFNDSTVQIASSLSVLSSNALMGLALLVIILGLFIGVRNSLITALGIPVTFALTFLVLDLLGETINTNTLFGLVLVLGLIVDHGIVIIENSYRLQTLGMKRHEAAILGVNQVIWPIIAATGTTVAAFLPLMIIPGTIGKFLRVIPLTVTIALIVSTFEALFFLPSHYAEWGPRERNIVRKPKKDRFGIFVGRYRMFLENLYNRKGLYLVILLLITVGVFSLVGTLKQDLCSAEDYSYFNIEITTPLGSTLDQTNRIVQSYEEVLLGKVGNGEILSISSNIGGSGNSQTTTQAQITVDLAEKDQGRQRSIEAIIDELKRETYYLSGSEQVLFTKAQTGPPTSADFSFRLSGDSYQPIINAAAALSNALASIENVSNVQSDFVPGNPVLRVEVNQDQASRLGISVSTIAGYLRSRFDGVTVGTFFLENEEIDIIAQFAAKSADRFEDLEQILIPTDDLRLVPLSSVATIKLDNSIGSIRRVEGKREITITADASGDVDQRRSTHRFASFGIRSLKPGMQGLTWSWGEFADFSNLLIDILRVFVLGIFLMYLILGAQFNSYSQPFLILLSVPFAFIGVVLYLFVSGTPLSTTVIYSAVALAGVAVNDAIVLISFINDLRSEGKSVREAVFESAVTRIRPILLTSLTTIAGLLPTAIGIGGYSVVWSPMASTIMVGLVFSTLSALLIIPLLYGVLYDRKPRSAA
jgi:multidrug efflux pump subunit AcrB